MKILLAYNKQQRYFFKAVNRTMVLFVLTAVLAFSAAIINQTSVYAGGAIGDGGGAIGTPGSSGYRTSKGHGWYRYPVSGDTKPREFENGTTWDYVRDTCINAGADKVIAYIRLNYEGYDANNGKVFNYKTEYDDWDHENSNASDDWLPSSEALIMYDSLRGVDKSGYRWGDNVAWFCYDFKPKTWSLSASTYVDNRHNYNVGETVYWKHTLIKSGDADISGNIISDINFKNFSNKADTEGHGTDTAVSNINPVREYTDMHVITAAEAGKTLCERALYSPINSEGATDGRGDFACVDVNSPPPPNNFKLTAVTTFEGNVNDIKPPGSLISFKHTLTNNGPTITSKRVDFTTYMRRVSSAEDVKPDISKVRDSNVDVLAGIEYHEEAPDTLKNEGLIKNDNSNMFYSITQADVGNWICGYMTATPKSTDDPDGSVESSDCKYISYKFELTATTTAHNDRNFAPGSNIYFNYTRTNNGPTKTKIKVTSSTSMTRVSGVVTDKTSFNTIHKDAEDGGHPLVVNHWHSEIDPIYTGNANGLPQLLPGDVGASEGVIKGLDYTITQADVGNSICGIIAVNPHSSEDSSDTFSYSCKYIPYNFSLKPETKIKVDNSAPESPITFQHKITNDGPTKTNDDVSYFTRIVRVSPKSSDITIDDVVAGTELKKTKYNSISAVDTVNKDGSLKGLLKDWFDDTLDKIAQDDVNNWVCSYLSAKPASQDNADYVSSFICKFIPYDYTLTPSVTVNPSEYIESGATYTVSPSVNNSGPTKSESTEWQLTRTIVSSGNAIDNIAGGISDTEPCTYYNNANAVCSPVKTGNTVFNSNSTWLSGDVLNNYISEADDYAVGTRICFALSVKPYKNGENKWSHSVAVCRVVVKKPKVQVWGGDLISGGKVSSSTSIKNGAMFGSWVEYGIFSAGLINGTASGSAFAGNGLTPISTPVSPCGYSMLSFVNAGTSACSSSSIIGNYTSSWPVTDIAASFPGDGEPISGTFVPSSTGEGVHIYSAGDLKLDTSNLVSKKTIIIKASGTVTIIGNQTYSNGPYTNTSDLPQLVIIANKIVINGNVENVDAWLVTKDGFIKTCDVVGDTVTKCDHKLTVNGPVIAKTLYLYRTAGSGTGDASGDPAEIFNLRADAYLWATARANVNNKIQTVYTTELPPRF